MRLLCSVVKEQAAGLFSFIEYQVFKLVPVNLGFLLLQPQASEPHSEICNVFWMRLSQPDGARAQFVTAHYCYGRKCIHKTRLWSFSSFGDTALVSVERWFDWMTLYFLLNQPK